MSNAIIDAVEHKNNTALFVTNGEAMDEADFRTLAKAHKCELLRIFQGPKWTMLYMGDHRQAMKFWKVLDKKIVKDLVVRDKDDEQYWDEDDEAYYYELAISWAINKNQLAAVAKKKKQDVKPFLGTRPPLGPAADLKVAEPQPLSAKAETFAVIVASAPPKLVDEQKLLAHKPPPPVVQAPPPPQEHHHPVDIPSMIPVQYGHPQFYYPIPPPQPPPPRPYEVRIYNNNGENTMNVFLTVEKYQEVIRVIA
jgi:hypothetical protein